MRICNECKWFSHEGEGLQTMFGRNARTPNPMCKHPEAVSRDHIFGKCYCVAERETPKGCGKQGRLWEAK